MPPNNDVSKFIVGMAGIIIGIYVLAELLKKKPGSQVQLFRCPKCNKIVRRNASHCWYCRIPLDWKATPPSFQVNNVVMWVLTGLLVVSFLLRFVLFSYCPPTEPSAVSACDRAFFCILGAFGSKFLGFVGGSV